MFIGWLDNRTNTFVQAYFAFAVQRGIRTDYMICPYPDPDWKNRSTVIEVY